PSEKDADNAAGSLKGWDVVDDEVKLYAIGVMTKDATTNKINTHKMGARYWGRGAGIGLVLGAIAAVPTGGASLAAAGGGAVVGGVVGDLFHKGLRMTDDEAKRLYQELDANHAAVGVLVDPAQTKQIEARLQQLGGVTETHPVSEDELAK